MLTLDQPLLLSEPMGGFQDLVRRTIARACTEQDITREELADRAGCVRETLYAAMKKPRSFGIEIAENIAKLARLNPLETMQFLLEWARDQAGRDAFRQTQLIVIEELMAALPEAEFMRRARWFIDILKKQLGVAKPKRRSKKRIAPSSREEER